MAWATAATLATVCCILVVSPAVVLADQRADFESAFVTQQQELLEDTQKIATSVWDLICSNCDYTTPQQNHSQTPDKNIYFSSSFDRNQPFVVGAFHLPQSVVFTIDGGVSSCMHDVCAPQLHQPHFWHWSSVPVPVCGCNQRCTCLVPPLLQWDSRGQASLCGCGCARGALRC